MGIKDGVYLALLALVAGFGAYLWFGGEHAGTVKCEAKDVTAVTVQEKADAKGDSDAVITLRVENERLQGLLAARPTLSIRVRDPASGPACDAAPRGGPPPATGGGSDPALRGRAGGTVDIGPGVQLLAEVGERLATQLRACQVKAAEAAGER